MFRRGINCVLLTWLSALVFGCSTHKQPPTVRASTDFAALDGQRVDVVGTYAVDAIGRYRITTAPAEGEPVISNQVVYIELSDGAVVRIGARPSKERRALEGATVLARGLLDAKPRQPPEHVAQMASSPSLIQVEKIEPADD